MISFFILICFQSQILLGQDQDIGTAFWDYIDGQETYYNSLDPTALEKEKDNKNYLDFIRLRKFWSDKVAHGESPIEHIKTLGKEVKKDKLRSENEVRSSENSDQWTFYGPKGRTPGVIQNIANQGRITAIAFGPQFTGDDPIGVVGVTNTLYAGSETGGIWKSDDGGANWYNLNTDFNPHLNISQIIVRGKTISGNVVDQIFAMGNSRFGNWGASFFYYSLNGGGSWITGGAPFNYTNDNDFPNKQVFDLKFGKTKTTILAAASDGIWRSTNSGQTWTNTFNNGKSFREIEILEGSDAVFATAYWDDKVYISLNGGSSFFEFYDINSTNNSNISGFPMQIDLGFHSGPPYDYPDIAYHRVMMDVTEENGSPILTLGVQVQSEGTPPPNWPYTSNSANFYIVQIPISDLFNPNSFTKYAVPSEGSSVSGESNGYDRMVFAVSPGNKNNYMIGSVHLYNGIYNSNYPDNHSVNRLATVSSSQIHDDYREIETMINSSGVSYAYVGTDGGVTRILLDDTKEFLNNIEDVTGQGLEVTQCLGVGQAANKVGVSTIDNGLLIVDNTGNGYQHTYGEYAFFEQSPVNDGIAYVQYPYGSVQRIEGFPNNISYQSIPVPNEATGWDHSFKPSKNPNTPEVLYAGSKGVYKSTNYGDDYTEIVAPSELNSNGSSNTVATVGIYDADVYPGSTSLLNEILYIGMNKTPDGVSGNKKILRYFNFLGAEYQTYVGPDLQYNSPKDIESHPSYPNVAFAVLGGSNLAKKFLVSTDYGTNWSNQSSGLPNVNCYKVVIEKYTNKLFLCTEIGVYEAVYTEGTPLQWVRSNIGLPRVDIRDLVLKYGKINVNTGMPNGYQLYVATYGRGVWKLSKTLNPFIPSKDSAGESEKINNNMDIKLYPNPVSDQLNIDFSQMQSGQYRIANQNGDIIVDGIEFKDELNLRIDMERYPPGVYFFSIQIDKLVKTIKYVKL